MRITYTYTSYILCKFFKNNFHDCSFYFVRLTLFSVSSASLLLQSERTQMRAWAFVCTCITLKIWFSFHAAVSCNQNTLRSLLKLSFHSDIDDEHRIGWQKNIRIYNMRAYSFSSSGRFFVLLFTDGRYSLTQTSVSSRNRTRDSPGLSNTGRCYLSSPSAIYFWWLMEFRHGARERKREGERTGLHTDERWREGRWSVRE